MVVRKKISSIAVCGWGVCLSRDMARFTYILSKNVGEDVLTIYPLVQ